MSNIAIDLSSPQAYVAGEELEVVITFSAPSDGTYYLLGALYDSDLNYIADSRFGIILPTGATEAINVIGETQLWEMEEDDEEVLTCKITLNRSSVTLGLFLMKLAGDEISFEDDTEIGSVSLLLTGVAAGIDLSMMMSAVVMVGMMGIAMKAMK